MHSQFTPKIWSASQVHSKSFGVHLKSASKLLVHFKSTPKNLECTQSPLQRNWSIQHSTPKMSKFWSAQLPTPIFLECAFCALQVSPKKWSAQNLHYNYPKKKLEALQVSTLCTPNFYFAYSKFLCGLGSFMHSKLLQFPECNTHYI